MTEESAPIIIRVIDFETTGSPEDTNRPVGIVEIGHCDVKVIMGEQPDEVLDVIVAPEPTAHFCNPGHPIPPEIRAVHHISDEDIAGAISPDQGLKWLNSGNPDYFCAHQAMFERHYFGGGQTPWLCTYRTALRFYRDFPGHGNQVLRYCLGIELPNEAAGMPPHRAGPDAYVTAHILARLIKDGARLEDMVRWSNGPPLLVRVGFGKHKGKLWEELPADYLDWIAYKSDFDEDTKANARHWLKKGAR